MERLTPTPQKGYVLSDKESVADILAVEAELLRSEGVDPRWPGFPEDDKRRGNKPAG
jgi:hypothetical protein